MQQVTQNFLPVDSSVKNLLINNGKNTVYIVFNKVCKRHCFLNKYREVR